MAQKMYALVGNWSFKDVPKGLSVYSYEPENGSMTLIDTYYNDVGVGNQFFDADSNIVYMVHECINLRGQIGGGGYVLAAKLDMETGVPQLLSEKKSLGTLPSYVCVDQSKKYIVVSHHVTDNHITKLVRNSDGSLDTVTEFDDASLVLFRLNEDGSIGEACDAYIIKGNKFQDKPRLHAVYPDPTSELFITCDKGCDRVIAFKIDRENGKLVRCGEAYSEEDEHPRYGAFHKNLPVFYSNNEEAAKVYAYGYDIETGDIKIIDSVPLMLEETEERTMPSDICIHPTSKYLYVSIRGNNMLSVIALDENGKMELKQNIPCGGENPRGLCMAPDGKYLFAINAQTKGIVKFAIDENGCLTMIGEEAIGVNPANMLIVG